MISPDVSVFVSFIFIAGHEGFEKNLPWTKSQNFGVSRPRFLSLGWKVPSLAYRCT